MSARWSLLLGAQRTIFAPDPFRSWHIPRKPVAASGV
jgi:hypothetical protein